MVNWFKERKWEFIYLLFRIVFCLLGVALNCLISFLLYQMGDYSFEFSLLPTTFFEWLILILFVSIFTFLLPPLTFSGLGWDAKLAKERENRYAFVSYDVSSKTLTILNRTPKLSRFISIKKVFIMDYEHIDPKLIYTGATVGGVTTGGFHVQKGGYKEHVSDSGKYQLIHKTPIYNQKHEVEKICLSKKLLSSAKSDSVICTFLVDNTLELRNNKKVDEAMAKLATDSLSSGNMSMAISAAQRATINSHLSKDDCVYIKRWLCGKI